MQKGLQFLKLIAKTYVLYIIIFSIAYLIFKSKVSIDNDSISEIMKSSLTLSSILLGFFGTLLAQIINLKTKYANDKNSNINVFFQNVSQFELKYILKTNVFNTVLLDVISLVILIQGNSINNNFLFLWGIIFTSFIAHQCYVYYIFIELLLLNDKKAKVFGALSENQLKKLNSNITTENIEKKAFNINKRIKHD